MHSSYLWGEDLNNGRVLVVVDVDVALDALLNARLLRRLEDVRVVEVLQRLWRQIDAQLFQLVVL